MKLSELDDYDLMDLNWLATQLGTTVGNLNQRSFLIRKGRIPSNSLPPFFQPPHSRPRVLVGEFKKWIAEHQLQHLAQQAPNPVKRGRGRPRKAASQVTCA
jgi:hypothetical protein